MVHPERDSIKICDFGFAQELSPGQFSKYGSPEFVAPEIVCQDPVSKATDIWSIGVIAFLCLTGSCPFAGENDKTTLMNVREGSFSWAERDLECVSEDARDFVEGIIKVVPEDRPTAGQCLTHRWLQEKQEVQEACTIKTKRLKFFISRNNWQRSLTCYRSVLVMRSIPGLLGTAPEGSSLGMPRHLLKEHSSSTPSASSSDLEDSSYPTKAFTAPAANLGTQKNLEHSGDGKEQREQQRGSVSSSSDFSVQGSNGDKSYGSVLSSSVAVERQPQIISELGSWGFPEGAESTNKYSQPLAELRLSKSSMESSVSQAATVGKGDFPAEEGAATSSSVRGISADRALALPIQGEERAQASVDGSSKPPCTLLPRHSVIRSTFYSDVQASPLQLSRDPSAEQGQYSSSLESMRKRIVQAGYSTGNVSGLRQPLLECFQTDAQDLTADRALGSASVSPVPTADSLLYFVEQSSRKIKSLDELETKVLAQPAARESESDTLKPFLLCDEDSEPDSSAVVFAHYSNIARPVYLGQRDSAVMESRSGLAEEAKGLRYGLKYSTKGIPLAAKVNQSAHIGFVSSPCPETGTDLGLGVGKKICLTSSSESHERCSEAGASAFWWGSPEPQTTTRAASTASNEGIGFVGSGSVKQYSDDPSVLPSVSQSKCPDSQGSSKCPSRPSSAPASDLTSQRQEEASRENTSSSYFDAVKVETDYFDLSDPCSSELLRSKEFEEKSISKNRPIPAGYVSKEQFPLGDTEAASAIQSEDTMSAASSEVSCDETGLMDDGYRDLGVDIWESDMLQLLDDTELDEGNGGAGDEAEGESDKKRKSSLERKMHQTFQSLKKTFKTSRGSKSSASSSDTSLSRSESHAETLPRSTSTKFGKAGLLGLFRRSTSLNWDRGLADKEDGRSRYSLSVLQDLDSHERLRELKGKKKSKPLPASLEGRSAAENSGRQERQKGESDETPARPDPLKVELDQSQYMEIVTMPSKSAPIALEDGAEEKPEDLPTPSGDVPSDSPKKKSRLFSFQFPGTKPKEKAPSFLEGLQNQLVVLNQSVTLSCTPSGRPNPAIYWFKDDLPICSSKRMKLSATVQGCQLVTIWSVTEEDLGRYECVAENSLGKASTGCCVTGAGNRSPENLCLVQ
uniref:Protein kinase domain-containing protein n=1 Tax=Callorhinchus milii TaxID=7868 RepID=A0A4W3HQ89_CALMI